MYRSRIWIYRCYCALRRPALTLALQDILSVPSFRTASPTIHAMLEVTNMCHPLGVNLSLRQQLQFSRSASSQSRSRHKPDGDQEIESLLGVLQSRGIGLACPEFISSIYLRPNHTLIDLTADDRQLVLCKVSLPSAVAEGKQIVNGLLLP